MGRWWAELPGRVLGPMFALDAARVGRRTATFLVRWAYLLVLAVVLGLFFLIRGADLGGPRRVAYPTDMVLFAESFFWVYTLCQFLFVVVVTPSFTAAAITDEKERKTLDFLLVTDLSGREIVFGKLAARVGALFTLVLAGLPILSLVQFFGGIDPELLLLITGVTLATVLSLAAIGMAGSVGFKRTRDAVIFAYVLPIAYVILSSWAYSATRPTPAIPWGPPPPPTAWMPPPPPPAPSVVKVELGEAAATGNPLVLWEKLEQTGRVGTAGRAASVEAAAWYAAFHGAVAVLGAAFAGLRLRSSARAAVVGRKQPRGRLDHFVAWLTGQRTTARWHPRMGNSPVLWREVYVEPGSRSGLLNRLVGIGVIALVAIPFLGIVDDTILRWWPAWLEGSRQHIGMFQSRTQEWVTWVSGGLGTLMLLRATVDGAGAIAGEKDRNTWVSLLATRLSCWEILWGKWWGCVWGQRHAMMLLLGVWGVGVLTGSVNLLAVVLAAAALIVYMAAFAALGLRFSANAPTTRRAVARSVPLAVFLVGGFWVPLGCLGMAMRIGATPYDPTPDYVGHAGAFLAGCTPPVVLAGLPSTDFDTLAKEWGESQRNILTPVFLIVGLFGGLVGWGLFADRTFRWALAAFAKQANRPPYET